MFKRIARTSISLLIQSRKVSLNRIPTYQFCDISNRQADIQNIRSVISRQLTQQESQKQDLSQFTNFFQNQGWKIQYNGIQVQLSNQNGPYDLKILFNAKVPMNFDQQQGNQQQMQDFNVILSGQQAQIGTATFIKDFQADKAQRKKGKALPVSYPGPQLSTLDQQFQQQLYQFIDTVGINSQVLGRAAQFSVAYENQFYINWLKDMKSLI